MRLKKFITDFFIFLKPVFHCSFFETCFYLSTGIVADMSSFWLFFVVTGILGLRLVWGLILSLQTTGVCLLPPTHMALDQCESSMVVQYYNIYMNSIIQYGLLVYGCTRKSKLKDILLRQKKVLRITFFKNRYPSNELFERSRIMSVYDPYVCELIESNCGDKLSK